MAFRCYRGRNEVGSLFENKKDFYLKLIDSYLNDESHYHMISDAIKVHDWKEACSVSYGLSGNAKSLGLGRMYRAIKDLVDFCRLLLFATKSQDIPDEAAARAEMLYERIMGERRNLLDLYGKVDVRKE